MRGTSVVIPCYNASAYVGEAITSALDQSCAPAEIIVVDDGSSDGSAVEVEKFGDSVRLIRQPNRGAAAARNAGVAASSGTFLAFLDADDIWPEESLAIRTAEIERSGADLVFGRVRQSLGRADETAPALGPIRLGRLLGAVLVRRSVFELVGQFNESLRTAEIIDWIARAQEARVREASCDAVVLHRRIHGANTMLNSPRADFDRIAVLRSALARRSCAATA